MNGGVQELDWEGNIVWEWRIGVKKRVSPHDIERLPNGNILVLAISADTSADLVLRMNASTGLMIDVVAGGEFDFVLGGDAELTNFEGSRNITVDVHRDLVVHDSTRTQAMTSLDVVGEQQAAEDSGPLHRVREGRVVAPGVHDPVLRHPDVPATSLAIPVDIAVSRATPTSDVLLVLDGLPTLSRAGAGRVGGRRKNAPLRETEERKCVHM